MVALAASKMLLELICVHICIGFIRGSEVSQPFISRAILRDGVFETNILANGIRFMEMRVASNQNITEGIVVRQLTNGRNMVNLIYNENSMDTEELTLKECQVIKNSETVNGFLQSFDEGFTGKREYKDQPMNISISFFKDADGLSRKHQNMLDFKQMKQKCFQFRRSVKLEAHKNKNSKRKRHPRSLNELLIFPGTKWCGNKRLARSYRDLAGHTTTDSCCREHDLCPISIPMLTKKYGLYNKFLTTISHCSCDRRFKTCLKRAGTGASDIVGRVFFNVVQSKCFVFEKQKVCLKYGLWSCYKWGFKKQGVIKEPSPWY